LNRSEYVKNTILEFATFREISKSDVGIKARKNYPMETRKIKREIVAVFMENPLYFTIKLQRRMDS
jgi:hypothetical protein